MANTQTANRTAKQRQELEMSQQEPMEIGQEIVDYLRNYAHENPEAAALWCFGIGFVLGWKLKIW
jgi:hypothetical protein